MVTFRTVETNSPLYRVLTAVVGEVTRAEAAAQPEGDCAGCAPAARCPTVSAESVHGHGSFAWFFASPLCRVCHQPRESKSRASFQNTWTAEEPQIHAWLVGSAAMDSSSKS